MSGGLCFSRFQPLCLFPSESHQDVCFSPQAVHWGLGPWFPACQGDLALPALQVAGTLGDAGGRSKPSERSDLGEGSPHTTASIGTTEDAVNQRPAPSPGGSIPPALKPFVLGSQTQTLPDGRQHLAARRPQ